MKHGAIFAQIYLMHRRTLPFTLDELNTNLREVITMLLIDVEPRLETEFVGTQTVTVG